MLLIAGITAQPLSYLTLSLQRTREFQTYSNKQGRVVSPGVWMLHKGLTFTKRQSSVKTLKDLYGIWYVATQLGDFSQLAIKEFEELAHQHKKWFKTFQKNLRNWVDNASPSTWSKLESQDPTGRLKKLSFQQMISQLIEQ